VAGGSDDHCGSKDPSTACEEDFGDCQRLAAVQVVEPYIHSYIEKCLGIACHTGLAKYLNELIGY